MYVMQSLPSSQQSLAGGIFNTIIRLCSTIALGLSTAVFSSVANTPQGAADPMLKYTRTFQTCVALSGAGLLFVPLLRLKTQGGDDGRGRRGSRGASPHEETSEAAATSSSVSDEVSPAGDSKKREGKHE